MKWAIAAVVVVAIAAVAGPFIYINFIKGDEAAQLEEGCDVPSGSTPQASTGEAAFAASAGGTIDPAKAEGAWSVAPDSVAGYRVTEVLFGQDATAVGRTSDVTGQLTVQDGRVTAATFEVDMTTVTSSESRRDNQFRGRIMDSSSFPTATFALTTPVDLPTAGSGNRTTASGDLTLRGVTKPVMLDITALDCGSYMSVLATAEIVFADFDIPDPNAPGITTQDHGLLEAKLRLVPA